jgi:nuclear transport factor 2 (NTF2) superfamily protein
MIKTIFLLAVLAMSTTIAFSQATREQRIEDSLIGWQKILTSADKPKLFEARGRTFSIRQQENMHKIIEWMQKSYTPVAGIGTYKTRLYASENDFNPHQYGIDFRVWNVSYSPEYLDAKGHFKPVSEEYNRFDVSVNMIPGSYPISFINTPDHYIFSWPADGFVTGDDLKEDDKIDPRINPNVYKFITRINEKQTVFLAPGNRLPVVEVSIGEYLQLVEKAFDNELQKEKERINNQWEDQKTRDKVLLIYLENSDARYRNTVKQLREKYQDNLQDQAILRDMQPTAHDFYGDVDPFKIDAMAAKLKHYYPVYKLEPGVIEKCFSDQPQWIAISFPYKTKEDGNQEYEMYKSVTENFNYDYAYNYFFDPEKVKGKPYKPANEEQMNARLDAYRKISTGQKPAATSQASLPANVFFMDDFSGNPDGSKPAGWFFTSTGKYSEVISLNNTPGKWVKLGYNNNLSSTKMKKPLPENFTLEYDVATGDFSTRTGGSVVLYLSSYPLRTDGMEDKNGDGTTIELTITSGYEGDFDNNNYSGAAKIDIHSRPSVNKDNFSEGMFYTYSLREFTNKKNKVHVELKLKGGELTLFLNGEEAAVSGDFKMTYGKPCISCNLPAGTKFKTVYWKNNTTEAENVNVYISNVKITKE